jgi:hypothetical protein
MAQAYEIPLTPQAQVFSITLAGVSYQFTLVWRDAPGGGWFLDIADQNSNPLVLGLPLVTGVDLLAQYPHLNFSGTLTVVTSGDTNAVPTYTNLGTASKLIFTVGE